MSAQAGHGASVRIEACGKTFADGTRALAPATLDGIPVKFRKIISIMIKPT